MKRLLLTAVAGMMLVGPLASAEQYQSPPSQHQDGQHQDQNRDRDDRGQRDDNQARGDQRGDHNYSQRDRRDRRHSWRDQRREARWDDNQHNGYYVGSRWTYGPPPQSAYGSRNFQLGYHPWSRGQRLGYYNRRYQEVSYRDHGLRRPQRGYHWVQDDSGDYLMAAIVTGLIVAVVLNNNGR